MNDKIKYHLCFKYVCNWITLLIFKHTLLITSHGSCVFKAFYRKFNNRYRYVFKKISQNWDESWPGRRWNMAKCMIRTFSQMSENIYYPNKNIYTSKAYLNSKALIGSFRHDGCPGSKAWLRTHPRRCTSCWPNTCHTLSIQITSTSLLL